MNEYQIKVKCLKKRYVEQNMTVYMFGDTPRIDVCDMDGDGSNECQKCLARLLEHYSARYPRNGEVIDPLERIPYTGQ